MLLLPVLAFLHLVAISYVGWDQLGAPPPVVAATTAVIEIAAPPDVKVSPRLIEVAVVADVAAPSFEVAAAPPVAAASGGDCSLSDAIGTALRDSPATPVAFAGIPVATRTVANALMMWDGSWAVMPADAGGAGLAQLRTIVERTVRSAPASCQSATVTGPRLIVVPDGNASIVLAFGSGTWAWSDLLE